MRFLSNRFNRSSTNHLLNQTKKITMTLSQQAQKKRDEGGSGRGPPYRPSLRVFLTLCKIQLYSSLQLDPMILFYHSLEFEFLGWILIGILSLVVVQTHRLWKENLALAFPHHPIQFNGICIYMVIQRDLFPLSLTFYSYILPYLRYGLSQGVFSCMFALVVILL